MDLVHVELAPGDVLFFHSNTLHASDQNKSEHPRWSFICCYNTKHNDPYKASHHPFYEKLEKVPDAKFVVAGSGDMAVRMIEEAAALGIGHRVLFTGFLRGKDVDRIFRMADVYVMPSVSEPFGIAPLEAMRNDVPVIISKTSGVSEVLTHALKVDFWDIDEMANKIVAVLRHPPLGQTLREHGSFELRRLTWDGAAQKCVQTYAKAIGQLATV